MPPSLSAAYFSMRGPSSCSVSGCCSNNLRSWLIVPSQIADQWNGGIRDWSLSTESHNSRAGLQVHDHFFSVVRSAEFLARIELCGSSSERPKHFQYMLGGVRLSLLECPDAIIRRNEDIIRACVQPQCCKVQGRYQ